MVQVNTLKGLEELLDSYFVSKEGKVYTNGKEMKQSDNGRGYKVVKLKVKGIRKWKHCYVHRLVAAAYVANPMNKAEVNHKDENKSNNNSDNLEWVTRKENNNYGTKNERMRRTRCRKIYVYDTLLNFVGEFLGMNEATLTVLGYSETRRVNRRVKGYFFLDKPLDYDIIEIANKSIHKVVVLEDQVTGDKKYFETNREARRFFDNKVNISDSIKKKHLIRNRYKAYYLNYRDIIDSPNLRE